MKIKLESLRGLEETEKFVARFEDTVPDAIGARIGEMDAESVGFPALLGEVLSVFSDKGSELGSFFLFVLGTVMLMALASFSSGKLYRAAECAVVLIAGVSVFSRIYALSSAVSSTMGGVLNFFTAFIPILTGVVAYGGGGGSAAVGAAGANMTLGIMGAFVLPILEGCVSLIFALGLVSAVGEEGAVGLARRVKSFFTWLVGLASTLLLSSLALQSAIASSSDTAAVRAAKYAASGTIPIVGGSVSSAMGTLTASVAYVKSVIGVGAITVILMTVLSPLVTILLYRLILSAAEGMLDFLGVGFGAKLFSSFRHALDVLAAVFALSVTVLIVETALLMKSGAAL